MRSHRFSLETVGIFVVLLIVGVPSSAQEQRILHSFSNSGQDGYEPVGSLVFDATGNLYGTALYGGIYGGGVVLELSPHAHSGWTEKILHSFNPNAKDGATPAGNLILDTAGNLYGTTAAGGFYGYGTVFELLPNADGSWREKILHSFSQKSPDGGAPQAGLIFDAVGNLYGTTAYGGYGANYGVECPTIGCGTVFKLTPGSNGAWSEKVLYSFKGNGTDGYVPECNLVFDSSGNLYGTTSYGGTYKYGTVFQLTPTPGEWTETQLHVFNNNGIDGLTPFQGLVSDPAGNLYGTTNAGGAFGYGAAFELSPSVTGTWTETILHSFDFNNIDGANPLGTLVFDSAGNLYGTTEVGGTNIYGTVFELTPAAGGGWTETILADFKFALTDGYEPYGGLILDSHGNLYGTTRSGGSTDYGTVYEILP